jgi:hypothetical protein
MYWKTVNSVLRGALQKCMKSEAFESFRLVGGTALSLQLGHRMSVDIDLFTDASYESIDFQTIDKFLRSEFPYVDSYATGIVGFGHSFFVGRSDQDAIKLDVYYTDPFIRDPVSEKEFRLAHIEDIIAMKIDVITRGGRKKDFWDLHACHDQYTIKEMISLHKERFPYGHNEEEIRNGFLDFYSADDDFDPICMLGKHWELIKYDFIQWLTSHNY